MNAAQSDQSCQLESLEDRQLFSAMGTMNIIDAGVAPSAITSYTLNGVKDFADAGVSNWTRSATNPGTFAGSPTPGEKFGVFCLEPDQEFPSGNTVAYNVIALDSDPTNGPTGAAKANAIRELWGRFRGAIGTDGTKAAAFQMAVWEIVTDSGRDLSAEQGHRLLRQSALLYMDQHNSPRLDLGRASQGLGKSGTNHLGHQRRRYQAGGNRHRLLRAARLEPHRYGA